MCRDPVGNTPPQARFPSPQGGPRGLESVAAAGSGACLSDQGGSNQDCCGNRGRSTLSLRLPCGHGRKGAAFADHELRFLFVPSGERLGRRRSVRRSWGRLEVVGDTQPIGQLPVVRQPALHGLGLGLDIADGSDGGVGGQRAHQPPPPRAERLVSTRPWQAVRHRASPVVGCPPGGSDGLCPCLLPGPAEAAAATGVPAGAGLALTPLLAWLGKEVPKPLSPREAACMALVVRGGGDKQIADSLGVAPTTVSALLTRARLKLRQPTRAAAAVAFALQAALPAAARSVAAGSVHV